MRQEYATDTPGDSGEDAPEGATAQNRLGRRSPLRALKDPLVLATFALAFVADQVTKGIVLATMYPGESHHIFGIVRMTFVRNTGAAFGFFQDYSTLITVASVIAVAAIAFAYRHAAMVSPITRAALGLQVGGALGNVLDRFRHGYVVDFIDVGAWPVFNIADSAIVSGIAVLVVYFTLIHDHEGDPEYEGKQQSSQGTEDPEYRGSDGRQTSNTAQRDADSKE